MNFCTLRQFFTLFLLYSLSISPLAAQELGIGTIGEGVNRDDLREVEDHGVQKRIGSIQQVEAVDFSNQKTDACATVSNLATPYNTNNGQRGCMFDVLATNTVTIQCFDASLYSGTTADYEIYYRAGTHVGNQNNAAAWTFVGGPVTITSAGNNVPTAIPIPVGVVIPAGQTYSFYITNTFGGGTSYTDGTAVGNFLAGDANITVFEGVGKSYPFGLTFNVRNFNGTIFYDPGAVLNEAPLNLQAEAGSESIDLAWGAVSLENGEELVIEKMREAGSQFEALRAITGTSSHWQDREVKAGNSYFYRLRLQSPDGSRRYSPIVEARINQGMSLEISEVYPNPFDGSPTVGLNVFEEGKVVFRVTDLQGKVLKSWQQDLQQGRQSLRIGMDELPAGIMILEVLAGEQRQRTRLIKQ